jgi:hypothetical protein
MCCAAFRRDVGAAKPAALYRFGNDVGFIHPVNILHVSLSAVLTCLVWADLLHTGHAYCAVEKQSACAVSRRTLRFANHLLPVSLLRRLFLVVTFCLVLMQ